MSQFLVLQFYLLFVAEIMINKYHVRPVVQNESQELDMHFWFFDSGSAIPRQIAVLVVLQIVWNANIIYVDCDMAHFTEYPEAELQEGYNKWAVINSKALIVSFLKSGYY